MTRNLNLPNLLTASRLAAAPLVVYAIWRGAFAWALVLLVAAGLTDALDGWAARRCGSVTRLGAYLDPVADKILLVTVYLSLAAAGLAPVWLVALVVARDVLILGFAGVSLAFTSMRRFEPSVWGKLSTVVQVVTSVALISGGALQSPSVRAWSEMLIVLTAVTTAWSGLHYGLRTAREMLAVRQSGPIDGMGGRE